MIQTDHEVLCRLVPCLKCVKLALQVLLGHFGPVYLLQVSKNDAEIRCFLKKFGFIELIYFCFEVGCQCYQFVVVVVIQKSMRKPSIFFINNS